MNNGDAFEHLKIADLRKKKKKPKCMLVPEERKYKVWQGIMTTLLVVQFILVPLVIAFRYRWLQSLKGLELFFDLFFLADILISFRTALNPEIKHRFRACLIFQDYAKSYLVFDLLATIPTLVTA